MSPVLCNYYVTLRCNSRCVFCNIWKDKSKFYLKEQNLEQIKNNLMALKRLGVKVIDFTGGEPLLYPHLIGALREAKKQGFYTTITTNCLLYPKYASELKGFVDKLQFSLESADEKEYNKIRGVASYADVIKSIEIAKEKKQRIYLIHTVTDENFKSLPSLIKFAQDKKCTLILNPCFEYFENDAISKSAATDIKKYFSQPFVVSDLANIELILDGGNNVQNPVCKAISSTIVISPDNFLLLPCYHHTTKKIKINNNLFEIYNSEEIKKLKASEGKFQFCKNCTIHCYMRASFYNNPFSKYFLLTAKTYCKYLREYFRK
ncbi:radical SAM protein [archaeon]|nr:radical SAM protein [Nanoarchaeota archaeon]MBU4299819.1 radical SAM protein [Nanoarchaeota archaeon]MBU4451288.1 radical SAM protein [Nanoarchaeota archaeon]MCG2723577.1 radical SAM protein [archaeon]